MTSAVYRSGTPSLSVPQTQNTAPVLEFNCLYSHDVRRKQKRWQDGFLRFHTFNKRVMVYDVPRNFVGDAHWKEDGLLQDGDELTLERNGVLVQVAESTGVTETDLTELRNSRKKASSEHGSSSPMRPPTRNVYVPQTNGPRSSVPSKHRSLTALLGTPKGVLGKAALPARSPFEERHAGRETERWEDGPPQKRRRVEAQEECKDQRTCKSARSPATKKAPTLWARTADSINKQSKASKFPPGQEVIDLCDDVSAHKRFLPGFSSEARVPPSSPPKPSAETSKAKDSRQNATMTNNAGFHPVDDLLKDVVVMRSPPHQAVNLRETSEAVTTSVVFTEVRTATRPAGSKAGRTLRVAASAPKKRTLLCQEQMSQKPSHPPSVSDGAADVSVDEVIVVPQLGAGQSKARSAQVRSSTPAKPRPKKPDAADRARTTSTSTRPREPEKRLDIPAQATTHQQQTEQSRSLADLDQVMPAQASRLTEPRLDMPPPREQRELHRAASDGDQVTKQPPKRPLGAPVRVTPPPAKRRAAQTTTEDPPTSNIHKSMDFPLKARSKKSIQRAATLNIVSGGTSTVILAKPFKTPHAPRSPTPPSVPPKEPEPWSREAFDLFSWRPPGWDEEGWCCGGQDTAA